VHVAFYCGLSKVIYCSVASALIAFREMEGLMSPVERARWCTECETVRSFLGKIKDRGA
jgi:hypothetical protein